MSEPLLIDLHSHTNASDGQLPPAELVARAIEQQVQMLAITDHDTVAGLAQAEQFNLSHPKPLILINGVEISSNWHHIGIHVVALNIDVKNIELMQFLSNQCKLREQRAQDIGVRLKKVGIDGAYEGSKALADGAAICRSHYARWLVDNGYAANVSKVFSKYLARGKIAYVPNPWPDIADVIAMIHRAGGIAVLAHPSRYKLSAKWLRRLVREFKSVDGDAMEVVLSQQTVDDRNNLIALSQKNGLFASLGSDFHHIGNWIDLGKNMFQPQGVDWVWKMDNWMVN